MNRNGGGRTQRQNTGEKDKLKLYIGNLSFQTNENTFRDFVKEKGFNPSDVYLVKNQDRSSKGFGYLKFENE